MNTTKILLDTYETDETPRSGHVHRGWFCKTWNQRAIVLESTISSESGRLDQISLCFVQIVQRLGTFEITYIPRIRNNIINGVIITARVRLDYSISSCLCIISIVALLLNLYTIYTHVKSVGEQRDVTNTDLMFRNNMHDLMSRLERVRINNCITDEFTFPTHILCNRRSIILH